MDKVDKIDKKAHLRFAKLAPEGEKNKINQLMRIHLVILIFVFFTFNQSVNAQENSRIVLSELFCDTIFNDTVFYYLSELKVNNNSFLYDLDTMLQKSYLSCEVKKNKKSIVNIIYIKQESEDTYLLTIKKEPLTYEIFTFATIGFFYINNTCFFVHGILSKYPKELFTRTDNQQQFYYLKAILPEGEQMFYIDEKTCTIELEYKNGKLFFLRKHGTE